LICASTLLGDYLFDREQGYQPKRKIDEETLGLLRHFRADRTIQVTDRVFQRPDGSVLRHWHVQTAWKSARRAARLAEFHFHDLRHAGLTAMAETGIPLSELKERAGHSTVAAAQNYQHRARQRGEVEAQMWLAKKSYERGLASGN
jgi:integrase